MLHETGRDLFFVFGKALEFFGVFITERDRQPASVSFTKTITGIMNERWALKRMQPPGLRLEPNVRTNQPLARVRLDREKLSSQLQEAIRSLIGCTFGRPAIPASICSNA